MKLFTRKNALLLTAVIILLAAACAFALSREQKPLLRQRAGACAE